MTTLTQKKEVSWPWLTILLLAPFQFIFGLIYSWGAIAPAIHQQAGWSHSTLDLAFSLTPLALLPAVVWSGHNLQRFTPKAMLAMALGCFTGGSIIALRGNSPMIFILGYSVLALGLGAGLSTAACISIVSRLYPTKRGTLSGILLALYGMSSVVSAPLFESLNSHLSWRNALTILLGSYALLGWIAWAILPVTPITQDQHAKIRIKLRIMFRHRPLLWALALILMAAPLGSISFATIAHLAHKLGYSPSFIMFAVTIMAAGNGLGRFGFGVLADKYGAPFSRNAVLVVNTLAAAILVATFYGAIDIIFPAYPLLVGVAFGGMAGKLPGLAAHIVEDSHADTAFGLLFGTFALASFLGPLISSTIGMQDALTGFALSSILAWFCSIAVP